MIKISNVKELLESLERYRNDLDFSKEKMARELNVSLATYMNWTNTSTNPHGENILKIIEILKDDDGEQGSPLS
ncbi:helix-turn-helix transcriptional regulator [Candidatus Bipolaricaulota bacterium]|nr:helix-turn-helix transcriptional regulator [Candidatus Bipolaricaulota bacterium]